MPAWRSVWECFCFYVLGADEELVALFSSYSSITPMLLLERLFLEANPFELLVLAHFVVYLSNFEDKGF
jgi:hypothetical protein